MNKLAELAIQKYGTITKAINSNATSLSRTQRYQLLKGTSKNPGLNTIVELARFLDCDENEIINYYKETSDEDH